MISTTDPDYEIQVLRWSPIDGEYEGSGLNVLSDTGKIMDEALATSYEVFTEFTACLSEDDYEEVSYDYDSYGDYSCRSGIGYVTLLTHPCMDSARDSSSPEACAAVCTDPERLFGSWTTLWTCLTLASMSLAVEKFKGDGDGLHNNITSFVQSVAEPGVNITTFDGREVLSATHRCAMASCSQNSVGNCFTDFDSEAEKFFGNDSDDWSFLNSTYCYGVEGSINVDVAGPGVSQPRFLESRRL